MSFVYGCCCCYLQWPPVEVSCISWSLKWAWWTVCTRPLSNSSWDCSTTLWQGEGLGREMFDTSSVNQWLKRLKLLSQLILYFSFTEVSRLAEVLVSNLNSGIVKIKFLLTIIVHCQVEARESRNHQLEGIVTAKSSKLTLHWEYDNQIKVWTVQLRDGWRQELEYELDF